MQKDITPKLKRYIIVDEKGEPIAPTIKTLHNDDALNQALKIIYPDRIIENFLQKVKYTKDYWVLHTYMVDFEQLPDHDRFLTEYITVMEEVI